MVDVMMEDGSLGKGAPYSYSTNRKGYLKLRIKRIMRGRGIWTMTVWVVVLYFVVLHLVVFVGMSWRYSRRHYEMETLKEKWREVAPPTTTESQKVTKVLFLGYRRGGSSISSEIFDNDTRAMFLYEPLDAFYFSKTGYHGRKDQRILMYEDESDFRPVEPWEHHGIVEFFKRIYDCELPKMPSEFLGHRFMKHTSAFADYDKCYQHLSPDSLTQDLYKCRDKLQHVCGRSVDLSLQNHCPMIMDAIHAAGKASRTGSQSEMSRILKDKLVENGFTLNEIKNFFDPVMGYRNCLTKLEHNIQQCLPKAVEACQSKKLRTVKIVRATMPLIQSIIDAIPDLKIIIFIRDPRAMAVSRVGKEKLELHMIRSLMRACKKMELDFQIKREIDHWYPEAVKVISYENFVQDPQKYAKVMYDHVGYSTPFGLNEFIDSHMFAGEDDGKKWGNIRTNATEIANKWRGYITPRVMAQMQHLCGDLIQQLGYPLYS